MKVDKVLKCILFLDIYINMVIFKIITSKVTEADNTINVNKGNVGNIYID